MLDALGAVTLECAWMRLEAPGIGMGADCGRGGMTYLSDAEKRGR